MQEINVDLEGLSRVHQTLNSIRHDLDDFDSSYASSQSQAMGHYRVIEAFQDYIHGWEDGVELIDKQLEVAGVKIEAAVEAYTSAEQHIGGMADQMKDGLQ